MNCKLYPLICSLFVLSANAEIKLPELISDNMVLQQQTNVTLWGEATPDSKVTISPSWTESVTTTTADSNGFWKTTVATPEAGFTPYSITISDGKPVSVNNVLIGEVWFCSGQSNMEMPLNGFWNCPIDDANNVIADAPNHPAIRMATIEKKKALTPQKYAKGSWK